MRYVIKQQDNGLYFVIDQWTKKVLVSDANLDYCHGFLAGIAAAGGSH